MTAEAANNHIDNRKHLGPIQQAIALFDSLLENGAGQVTNTRARRKIISARRYLINAVGGFRAY